MTKFFTVLFLATALHSSSLVFGGNEDLQSPAPTPQPEKSKKGLIRKLSKLLRKGFKTKGKVVVPEQVIVNTVPEENVSVDGSFYTPNTGIPLTDDDHTESETPPQLSFSAVSLQKVPTCDPREFIILGYANSGGDAVIHKVERRSDRTLLALKQVNSYIPQHLHNFATEMEILQGLQGLINQGDYSVGPRLECIGAERDYYIMEWIEGKDLSQSASLFDRSKNVQGQFAKTALAMTNIVEKLHQHGIIHLDLFPRNWMVDVNNNLRLLDYGRAKILGNERSPAYCEAPEVSPSKGDRLGYSVSTDVWVLGASLYDLFERWLWLSGNGSRPNFDHVTFKRLERFPVDIQALLKRLLDNDPTSRPTIEEVKQTLARLL
jgi:serine/threonine protein kinase